ncbi:hypothetical protein [Rhodococcus ruber]|uniref:hypothetical protein n=1 Tax=Rhodococcus ruber TaxID=1830 RepID=UPI003D819887
MTISTISDEFPTLAGRQEPHHVSVFPGDDEHGRKAVELGRRVGRPSMPWQKMALHAILTTNPDGLWTHTICCLLCPRQNGKSLILVMRCLYGLFKLGERIAYTAQRWKTAKDLYNRLWSIIRARPSLRSRVAKASLGQGVGYIELTNGAQIEFSTRSADSGRGLDKVDLLIYDEAYNVTDSEQSALSPTQLASNNPQTIYASTAVNEEQHPNGQILAGLRRKGLAGTPNLYFAEYMAPEEMDRDDPETWKYCNPSYGVIANDAKILKLRGELPQKSFDADLLGRGLWPVDEDAAAPEYVIDPQRWRDMTNREATLGKKVALAIDMSPDRKWVSIAAAARTDAGRVHLEVGYHAAPGPGLVRLLLSLIDRWDPCALVIDKASPAYSLHPDLVAAGIEPEVTTAAQMVQACGGFYDDAVNENLSHTGDPLLASALEGATKRDLSGGGWAWNRKGNMTISPLVAATLAHWALKVYDVPKLMPAGPAFKPTASEDAAVPALAGGFGGEVDVLTVGF